MEIVNGNTLTYINGIYKSMESPNVVNINVNGNIDREQSNLYMMRINSFWCTKNVVILRCQNDCESNDCVSL